MPWRPQAKNKSWRWKSLTSLKRSPRSWMSRWRRTRSNRSSWGATWLLNCFKPSSSTLTTKLKYATQLQKTKNSISWPRPKSPKTRESAQISSAQGGLRRKKRTRGTGTEKLSWRTFSRPKKSGTPHFSPKLRFHLTWVSPSSSRC
jgi:hypothetical protein